LLAGENVDSGEENLSISCDLLGVRGKFHLALLNQRKAIVVLSAGLHQVPDYGTEFQQFQDVRGFLLSLNPAVVEMRQFQDGIDEIIQCRPQSCPAFPLSGSSSSMKQKR